MNSVQMHLALTHVPVILSLVGLIMLIVAFFVKNTTLTKTSYVLLMVAAVIALPVFFTGEGTEEAVEKLPGVSDSIIEEHEDVAKLAMISIAAAGLLALAALFTFRWQIARLFRTVTLVLAITSGALMVQTAHLGGQIRHTEIRNGAVLQNANESGGADESNGNNQQEKMIIKL